MAGRLHVTIKHATGLGSGDPTAPSEFEPYCLCEIAGLKTQTADTSFRTAAIKGATCSKPAWDHKGEVSDGALNNGLEFSIWDGCCTRPDGHLGTATLPCDDMDGGSHTLAIMFGTRKAGMLVVELHGDALGAGADLEDHPPVSKMRHTMRDDMLKVFRPVPVASHAGGSGKHSDAKIAELIQAASASIRADRKKKAAPKAAPVTFQPPSREKPLPELPRRRTVRPDKSENGAKLRSQVESTRVRLRELDGTVTRMQRQLKNQRMDIWNFQRSQNSYEARVLDALDKRKGALDQELVREEKVLLAKERSMTEQLTELRLLCSRVGSVVKKQDGYLRQEREKDPVARHPAGEVFRHFAESDEDSEQSCDDSSSDVSARHSRRLPAAAGRGRHEDVGLSDEDDDDEESGSRDQELLKNIISQSTGGNPPAPPAMRWRDVPDRDGGDDESYSEASGDLDAETSDNDAKGPVGSSRRARSASPPREGPSVPNLSRGSPPSSEDETEDETSVSGREAATESWKQRAAENVPPLPGLAALNKGQPDAKAQAKAAATPAPAANDGSDDEIYTDDEFEESA